MSYVPVVVVPPQPSARAKELSQAVLALIAEYRKKEPKMSVAEVQQALELAKAEVGRGSGGNKTMKIALAVGLIALVLTGTLVFFFLAYFRGSLG